MSFISDFLRDEDGQGMAEYVFIYALVVVVVILGLTFLGNTLGNNYNKVVNDYGQGS